MLILILTIVANINVYKKNYEYDELCDSCSRLITHNEEYGIKYELIMLTN